VAANAGVIKDISTNNINNMEINRLPFKKKTPFVVESKSAQAD